MPISTSFTKESIIARFDTRVEMLMQHIKQALDNAGLEGVTNARTTHRYITRTGNLQSSINYCIIQDGKVVAKGQPLVVNDGSEGAAVADAYMNELAAQLQGLHLVMVAGMPYATYVEAMGLNVLDSASLVAFNSAESKIQDVLKIWSE